MSKQHILTGIGGILRTADDSVSGLDDVQALAYCNYFPAPAHIVDQQDTMITLTMNGERHDIDVDPSTPLLWVIREQIGLTGTKFGCGIAQCGACTVHLNGSPIRSCVTPVQVAANQSVTTIEGIGNKEAGLHAIQQAWVDEQVPQCGYCQSGQIMSAVALLSNNPAPTDDDIDSAMSGNICRCGTYPRIRKGIKRAAAKLSEPPESEA